MNPCAALASAIDDVALGAPPSGAFVAHLATCAGCTTKLKATRDLARRIDRAVEARVRTEPPPGFAERIRRQATMQRPRRWRAAWLGVSAGVALAAACLLVALSLGGPRATPATDISTLTAWRSPTNSLLVSRTDVLGAPFVLRGRHDAAERSRS